MSRSQGGRADEVRRARIILGLTGGQTLAGVSRSQSCSVNTVKLWRDRFLEGRISGLWGRHPGKAVAPGTERLEARIINWTLPRKPADGSTHWSSRKLAAALGLSHMRVARVWTKVGLQPSRRRHDMASDDPDFESKAAAIIGLYLKPPTSIGIPPPKGVPLSRTLGNRRASPNCIRYSTRRRVRQPSTVGIRN